MTDSREIVAAESHSEYRYERIDGTQKEEQTMELAAIEIQRILREHSKILRRERHNTAICAFGYGESGTKSALGT